MREFQKGAQHGSREPRDVRTFRSAESERVAPRGLESEDDKAAFFFLCVRRRARYTALP